VCARREEKRREEKGRKEGRKEGAREGRWCGALETEQKAMDTRESLLSRSGTQRDAIATH
jgi:predicted transposase YdaD